MFLDPSVVPAAGDRRSHIAAGAIGHPMLSSHGRCWRRASMRLVRTLDQILHQQSGVRAAAFRSRCELGEELLDGVEVRGVFRQEERLGARRADKLAHGFAFVASEIVHDDDIAGCCTTIRRSQPQQRPASGTPKGKAYPSMLASIPASMVNQRPADLGISNRFKLTPSCFKFLRGLVRLPRSWQRKTTLQFTDAESEVMAPRDLRQHQVAVAGRGITGSASSSSLSSMSVGISYGPMSPS